MGDVQSLSVDDLSKHLSKSTAQWLKDLSVGICHEEVKDRLKPTSLGAVKTFNKAYKFEDVSHKVFNLNFRWKK